ncbi:hypothetical protein Prudu_001382 [Prunus dulcis]|uniref:DUF4218 domain-containing protein n=1 Tax=Prunus dulcis TaxID=3755 RepID=A0A4Y1QNG1_PRUDU|nr:hypothetical protein Prudu_001382 [Prunus dulcis]
MVDSGIPPDVYTYGRGILPDAITLRTLLDALCQVRMTEEARKVFEAKIKYGMKLSTISCSILIFPPAFFTSMMHVLVHLPEEALLVGPVNYRWMLLGDLKKSVRNRAKPEGSIIEAWVQYESLTFCGMYLKDVETAFNRPLRNNDGGMRKEKLSVFVQIARPFGDRGRGESFSRNDMEVVHWFVLNNCDEIMTYLDEHEEMMKREHPSHLVAQKQRELFPQWFLDSVIS